MIGPQIQIQSMQRLGEGDIQRRRSLSLLDRVSLSGYFLKAHLL